MVIIGLIMIVMSFCILFLVPERKKDWSVPSFFLLLVCGIAFLYLGAINQGFPSAWDLEKSTVYENMTAENPPLVTDWKEDKKFVVTVRKVASNQVKSYYVNEKPINSKYFMVNQEGKMVPVNIPELSKAS